MVAQTDSSNGMATSPGLLRLEGNDASEASLQALEDLSVNGVYNAIAPHFSATRCSFLSCIDTR